MTNPFGTTRSRVVRGDHALIAPDSHVVVPLPGWSATPGVTLIAPRLGAGFVQYLAHLDAESRALPAAPTVERLLFVLAGTLRVGETDLTVGGYAYLPPGSDIPIVSASDAGVLNVFEREYAPQAGVAPPVQPIIGQEQDVEGVPFLGDPDARLRTLLPADDPAYDLAVNVFTYQPGATLPFVETHVMEHGLLMIAGAGVYRLGESYYPVQDGDAIWMAPYCPQWFVAMGKTPARYLYYKDVNRDPTTGW